MCVGPPLSNTTDCDAPPGEVPGQFHHYDIDVQSHDSLCILLDTLYGSSTGGEPDEWGLHPEGWVKWLRQDASDEALRAGNIGLAAGAYDEQPVTIQFDNVVVYELHD